MRAFFLARICSKVAKCSTGEPGEVEGAIIFSNCTGETGGGVAEDELVDSLASSNLASVIFNSAAKFSFRSVSRAIRSSTLWEADWSTLAAEVTFVEDLEDLDLDFLGLAPASL